MAECLFCRIACGEVASTKVYEDERAVAFRDIHPQTPTHVLVVPRKHVASLAEAEEEDASLLGHLLLVAKRVAAEEGLRQRGYRVVTNTGPDSGQVVEHLHIHLLGGRALGRLG